MARKISFINYKGGVGKTSLIVNVAASLAEMGKRVLIVDLDVQSNSSIWLMRLERWNCLHRDKRGHLYTIFNPGKERLSDCIVHDVVLGRDASGRSPLPGLDIVPTTFNLVDIEEDEVHADAMPPYAEFQEQLAEVEANYDFILFDCPPNILRASSCGIFSCNEIYVPVNPDPLSLIGLTLLIEKLQEFYKGSDCFRIPEMGPRGQIMGVILNSIKGNVDIRSPKARLQIRLNQHRGRGIVSSSARILDQIVRDAVVVPRSVTLGMPVCLVGKNTSNENSVRDDYRAIAREILDSPPKYKANMGARVDSPETQCSA